MSEKDLENTIVTYLVEIRKLQAEIALLKEEKQTWINTTIKLKSQLVESEANFRLTQTRLVDAQKEGIQEGWKRAIQYVRRYATSVAEIYLYCKAMRLSQETFLAAKEEQTNRLNNNLGKIIERI